MHWKEKNLEYTRFLTENKEFIRRYGEVTGNLAVLQQIESGTIKGSEDGLDEKLRKLILRKNDINSELKLLQKKLINVG